MENNVRGPISEILEKNTRSHTLSLLDWAKLGKSGVNIPFTTKLHGTSMEPLIRYMKDDVTIIVPDRAPMIGDIVLFHRSDGAFVVHRIYKINGHRVQTWGDNCFNPDAPIDISDVLGLCVSFTRGKRIIKLNTERQRRYGIWWMKTGRKRYKRYLKVRHAAAQAIRLFRPSFHTKAAENDQTGSQQ